ncbi:MAG: ABC transporter permease [Candidatus Acidiferrales bacterium]
MFARLVGESFVRSPRRKLLTAAALAVGMAVTTATLSVALDVGDRLAREFRSLGANLLVTPQSDTLPLEIGGVDYRPVDEGAYLNEADLGKLKTIFWRHNIVGFTPFLDVPASLVTRASPVNITVIGTWYEHAVPVPDGSTFTTGVVLTHPSWKIQGKWFADGAHECVIGEELAARLSAAGIKIGDTIDVDTGSAGAPQVAETKSPIVVGGPVTLLVTGIVSTGDAEDNAILVPLSIAQDISGHRGQFRQLFVSAVTKPEDSFARRDPSTMTPKEYDRWYCSPYISSIGHQIQQVLPGTDVRPIRRVAETEGRVLSRVGSLLWLVTLAALAAAALAVAATSAATVLDRRSEIGLMKALGATNVLVGGIFLAEQLLLAVTGGAVGFVIGAVLARILGESVFGIPGSFRIVLLPVVLALAAFVALVGSLIPLRRASHFEPAPILRGE